MYAVKTLYMQFRERFLKQLIRYIIHSGALPSPPNLEFARIEK